MGVDYVLFAVLSKLLVSLEESRRSLPVGAEDEAMGFLSDLLQSRELHALVKVHNSIEPLGKDDRFAPILSNVVEVAEEVLGLLAGAAGLGLGGEEEDNPEAAEVGM